MANLPAYLLSTTPTVFGAINGLASYQSSPSLVYSESTNLFTTTDTVTKSTYQTSVAYLVSPSSGVVNGRPTSGQLFPRGTNY